MALGVQGLVPNTLAKFWGAHAFAWGVTSVTAAARAVPLHQLLAGALSLRAGTLLALGAANLALATLLYRNKEEAGVGLAGTAAFYFLGCAALLHAGVLAAAGAGGCLSVQAPLFRVWHAVMAAGSAFFASKASLKDRLFNQASRAAALREHARSASATPTLCLINQQSGAKVGGRVGGALNELAEASGGRLRVVDLGTTPPGEALAAFAAEHAAYRVLVCGGDGTATWVLGAIEESDRPYRPPVALLPLGTGNDLARVLGWGKGIRFDSIASRVASLDYGQPMLLDRWEVRGELPEGRGALRMNNYMSIGVDAKAALLWARLSKRAPFLFRLRLINKLWYIICGTPEFFLHSYSDLHSRCTLTCDGEEVPLPKGIEGLMVMNTPSYGGGSDLWDEFRSAPLSTRLKHMQGAPRRAAMDDGLLEVVGVTDVVHLANSLGGISNGVRLCQGSDIAVGVPGGGVPLQIDGEPCNVTPGSGEGRRWHRRPPPPPPPPPSLLARARAERL